MRSLLVVFLGACAQAGDGSSVPSDARQTPDVITSDAPPSPIVLKQTTSSQLGVSNGFGCVSSDGTTGDDAWYRVFRLADDNITGGIAVNSVSFGVQAATGMPTVTIKVGTYSGMISPAPATLNTNMITPLAMTTYVMQNIAQGAPQMITVPIATNVPALSQVVVEISAPDLRGMSKSFLLAGNAAGESAPTWLRSTVCNSPNPQTLATLNAASAANAHLVIQVNASSSQ